MIYRFLVELFALEMSLIRLVFRFYNEFARCAYLSMNNLKYLVNFKNDFKFFNEFKNRKTIMTTIFFSKIDMSRLSTR